MKYKSRSGSLGNSSTASGSFDPGGTASPWLQLGRRDINFSASCTSFHIHSFISSFIFSVSMSYYIIAVSLHKCLEKHSCISFTFPIAILNENCSPSLSDNGYTSSYSSTFPIAILNQNCSPSLSDNSFTSGSRETMS